MVILFIKQEKANLKQKEKCSITRNETRKRCFVAPFASFIIVEGIFGTMYKNVNVNDHPGNLKFQPYRK